MPRLRTSLFFVPFFVGLLISSAWGQSLDSILSKLDQNYYYPQKQGLKTLSVQVQWEQLDVVSGSGKFLRNPDFNFIWKAGSRNGLGNFELAKGQDHLSEERVQELTEQIKHFREPIIPLTLKQKFLNFSGRVHKMEGNKLALTLNQTSSNQNYKLLVDSREWVIRKLRFQQGQQNVEGEFSYIKLEGKPVISESRSRFEMEGKEYVEVTRYTYKKVTGIWWVHRIDQTFKQEDQILQTYVFKLSNYNPVLSSPQ